MQELEDAILHGLADLAQVKAPLQLGSTVVHQHGGLEGGIRVLSQHREGSKSIDKECKLRTVLSQKPEPF